MSETDWYDYRAIRFTRDQMIWLIPFLSVLKEGNWPPNPQGSGYTDIFLSSRRIGTEGKFVKPVEIAAEVEYRLERTGIEGKLLVAEITAGMDIEEMSYESRRALNYISGWRRRKLSYQRWKSQRRYRRKE